MQHTQTAQALRYNFLPSYNILVLRPDLQAAPRELLHDFRALQLAYPAHQSDLCLVDLSQHGPQAAGCQFQGTAPLWRWAACTALLRFYIVLPPGSYTPPPPALGGYGYHGLCQFYTDLAQAYKDAYQFASMNALSNT